ncbi:MAG: anti-sigma factor [Vicinamibacterales bacterium]
MFQEAPGFEQRLSDLQAQIDRLTISLQLWRDGQERATPADERLSRFADDVADVLQEWSAIGDRHARAVDALERQVAAFATVEDRLLRESADRFETLQRMVQHEWTAMRHLQFEPAGSRREQAAELTYACVAATATRVSADPAAAIEGAERDLQDHLAALVLAPRHQPASKAPAHASVVDATNAAAPASPLPPSVATIPVDHAIPAMLLPDQDAALLDELSAVRTDMTSRLAEVRVLLRDVEARVVEDQEREHRVHQRFIMAMALMLVLAIVGGAWWASGMQRQVSATQAKLADVEAAAARSAETAAADLAAARAETTRLSDLSRRLAADTGIMGAVLSAPDLVRFGLAGVDGSSTTAQLLWSRSRGLVLSAAGLSAPPDGFTYQAWLLTESEAITAGLFAPDETGHATLISGQPPAVGRPVLGVSLTLEPSAGSATPTGRIVALNRLVRRPPPDAVVP